jgi:hypothetical protein
LYSGRWQQWFESGNEKPTRAVRCIHDLLFQGPCRGSGGGEYHRQPHLTQDPHQKAEVSRAHNEVKGQEGRERGRAREEVQGRRGQGAGRRQADAYDDHLLFLQKAPYRCWFF